MGRAVVVGAGIGGLAAALALHRAGWDVTVLERAPRLEPVGAGLSLWPNALRALDALGVGDPVRSGAAVSGASGVRRPDGRWLARSDVGKAVREQYGDPLVVVHRADLVSVLQRDLPPDAVRTAATVTGVDAGDDTTPAVVRTASGDLVADLVVAADGIRSAIRTALFPGHIGPRRAGYTAWRMVVPAADPSVAAFETWGRRGERFAVIPMADGRWYCYATAHAPADLVTLFGSWHEPVASVVRAVTPDVLLHQDVEHLPEPLPRMYRGRVAVLGDAAHAMTPDLGQGGCTALEDAVVLGWATGREPVPQALATWSAQRLPRTSAIARRSLRAGRLYDAPPAVAGLAARVMGLLPGAAVARGLAPVVDWHPPA